MASPSLALPGVLFVGEDERARLVAHLGSAAGWMVPKGVLGWSHEVSVVQRDALTEAIRRDARIVMPEEQIAAARMPLAHQAALKSPLVAVSSRITQKLVDAGIRVHIVGASEKYKTHLEEIAAKVGDTNERKVEIPLYLEAKKNSQGPFELEVGAQKVALGTHDRWLLTGPLTEPSKAAPAPAPKPEPAPAPAKAEPVKAAPAPTPAPAPKAATPQPAPAKAAPTPSPAPASAKPASQPTSAGNIRPLAAPMNPPRPASTPPKAELPVPEPVKVVEPEPVKVIEPEPVKVVEPEPKPEPVVEKKLEPVVEKKAEPVAPKVEEPRAVAKAAASTPPAEAKKGGLPILWIVIALAVAFAAYKLLLKH